MVNLNDVVYHVYLISDYFRRVFYQVLSGLYALNNASIATKDICQGCSGLGTCANKVCRCFVPQTGIFKALDMTRGADCAQVYPF